jgi:formate-dependent nitrite reductase membrane component NrfD
MFISWLIIAVLKGGFHFAYLGKPLRFWRIVLRPQTSWLARGFIFVVLFTGFAAIQLIFSYWLPGTAGEVIFKVLAGIMALAVATYTGFVMNYIKGIPLWNSALLPALFISCGILGGFGLAVIIALNGGHVDIAAAETGSRWLLIINALLIATYLWRATLKGSAGKQSVMEQMQGSVAPIFWLGVVTLGIIIPLAIAFSSFFAGDISAALLVAGVACEIIGSLALRYCILKAGAYRPLLPISSY